MDLDPLLAAQLSSILQAQVSKSKIIISKAVQECVGHSHLPYFSALEAVSSQAAPAWFKKIPTSAAVTQHCRQLTVISTASVIASC